MSAAVVKTAIAMESLLVFDQSEPVAKSLSERAAFIVSPDPDIRRKVASLFKKFYDARSGVVHGGRRKATSLTPNLIEGMDRVALLVCLTIGANCALWDSTQTLLDWCEGQRWGTPDSKIKVPFPNAFLNQAIDLCARE
jgi:hypothetical protein